MFRSVPLLLGLISAAWAQSKPFIGPLYTLSTLVGSGPQDERQAFRPETLAFDAAGNLYIGDINGRVYRVDPSGSMKLIAGLGVPGFSSDGSNGTTQLGTPLGVAADPSGAVYIADTSHNRVLKLPPSGTVTTFAGTGIAGSGGDGGPASSAQVNQPFALAVDHLGNVYIGEYFGARIRKVAPDGTISTVAGNGRAGASGDGGPAISAEIADMGIAVDQAGNVYIADGDSLVRRVSPDGTIVTVAGGGAPLGPQDGVMATAAWLLRPNAVAVDPAGNLYISDGWRNEVRKVTPDGIIRTVAGTGTAGYLMGRARAALSSQLSYPSGIALDARGNLYIADFANSVVRKVDTESKISLFASGPIGDGGPAAAGLLAAPQAIALDSGGNVYVNDGSGRIRRVDRNAVITTLAGTGEQGFVADGVPASTAPLNSPGQISAGPAGELWIADTGNDRVRKVGADGIIHTVAGSGIPGFSGDGGPAASAQLNGPMGAVVDGAGNLYIADTYNHRIRKVTPNGIITTVVGDGNERCRGDDGPADAAELASPMGLAVDSAGNLYVADRGCYVVRKVSPDGIITTVAGTGKLGSSNDGVLAASAALMYPTAVAVDSDGDLFIADDRIRRVRPDGIMDTVAGWGIPSPNSPTGVPLPGVDGVPAFLQPLSPRGIGLDSAGSLYIADIGSGRVRKGSILRSTSGPPQLLPRAIVNAANLFPAPVAPGEVVTLFGTDLGPGTGISAQPDAAGRFGTNLAGVRVLFGDVPAPVLYAQAYQVNAAVPFAVPPGAMVEVRVEYNGVQSAAATVEITEAAPAIFTLDAPSPRSGKAAALNQDGTINAPDNPTPVGSILTLYATGGGALLPAIPDGQIVATANSRSALPVFVSFAGFAAEVLYAGPAPGIVAGVLQINVRVPDVLCHGYWQCTLDANAVPVYLGMGQSDSRSYVPGKYVGPLFATVAVK